MNETDPAHKITDRPPPGAVRRHQLVAGAGQLDGDFLTKAAFRLGQHQARDENDGSERDGACDARCLLHGATARSGVGQPRME